MPGDESQNRKPKTSILNGKFDLKPGIRYCIIIHEIKNRELITTIIKMGPRKKCIDNLYFIEWTGFD